jgi:hypothetical protein
MPDFVQDSGRILPIWITSRDISPGQVGIEEVAVRNSHFMDRCFVVIVVLAFAAFFTGVAFSFIDTEHRPSKASLLLQNFRP